MRTDNGMSRCFGFLTFKDPSVIDEILKKKHNLDGKDIDPKRAIPREEQEKTEKIFVGGVKPEVTEEEFKEYFSQFGNVVEATLMSNKDTGRPRGFGFITFDNDQSVEAVLAKQGEIIIKDKPVEVKRALPKSKTAKMNHMSRRNNYMMDQRRSYAGPIRNSRMGDPRYMRGGYGMMGYGRDYGNRGNRGGYYGYGNGNGYGYGGYDNMNMYYRGHGGSGQQNYSFGYNPRYQYNNNGGQGYGYGNRAGDATNNYGYNSGYGNSRVNSMNGGGYSGNASNPVQGQQSQSRSSHGYHPYAH
jgi:heterogeneous nuclear ribonucleoprotein A1/A3